MYRESSKVAAGWLDDICADGKSLPFSRRRRSLTVSQVSRRFPLGYDVSVH